MTRRILMAVCTLLVLAAGATARAEESGDVKLRRWYLNLQVSSGTRDRWDIFERADLPPAPVEEKGRGAGLQFGYRFGGRFLLGFQLVMNEHEMADVPELLRDGEGLITGTVLFRERATLQPFLRGGFGGAVVVLERPQGDGHTVALGTAAIAGGGLQVRLSSRFSLEWELVANFTNFLEVNQNLDGDEPGEDWRVKTSHQGWRNGLGVSFWF